MSFTIAIACILIFCSICQWVAWRVKLPAIIFLPFVSFSVAIILFEGGLTLKFRDLLGLEAVIRNLVTINK